MKIWCTAYVKVYMALSCFSLIHAQCLPIPLSFSLGLKTTKNYLQLLGQKIRDMKTKEVLLSIITKSIDSRHLDIWHSAVFR